nr:hypothetical protein Datr000096 [Darna trima granulovirus]
MNLDFLKDLVGLNPIKTTYVSNNLRTNFNFILDDHVKDKNLSNDNVTLLEKLNKILELFTEDALNKELVYSLLGIKLDLTKQQFYYLYDKIKEDMYIHNLLCNIRTVINYNCHSNELLKYQLLKTIDDEDGFANIASFLMRECNNAVKTI